MCGRLQRGDGEAGPGSTAFVVRADPLAVECNAGDEIRLGEKSTGRPEDWDESGVTDCLEREWGGKGRFGGKEETRSWGRKEEIGFIMSMTLFGRDLFLIGN